MRRVFVYDYTFAYDALVADGYSQLRGQPDKGLYHAVRVRRGVYAVAYKRDIVFVPKHFKHT